MIYLDSSATTRISEEALQTYIEISRGPFGNPSSLHGAGLDAERILTAARQDICRTLGDRGGAGTVVFTSGGTEANNLAIFGRARAKARYRGGKILTTAGEHASVHAPLFTLRDEGYRIVEIPTVGGRLDTEAFAAECTPDVFLVSMMLVNNETGALYDLKSISSIMRQASPDAILHCDATQAYLKLPFSARSVGADMITLSSHKIEGPKGVGALWIDPDTIKKRGLAAHLVGGGQEKGLRSGTENVPGIAAFAKAAAIGFDTLAERGERIGRLREHLLAGLSAEPALSEVRPVLPAAHAPHILSLVLPDIKSEVMLHALSRDGIYVSSGSACSSHGRHGTPALTAFGLSEADADRTIRISLSHRSTEEELDAFLAALRRQISSLARIR
jgi:cysteine desulfurase